MLLFLIFCFKQKTAYEMRISDWSSDVCSSDLFIILRRQEYHRQRAFFTQAAKQFQPIHARHLYIENGQIRWIVDQRLQRCFPIRINARDEAFCLKRNGYRSQDILVVIYQGNCCSHYKRSEEHTSELQSIMPIS